MLPLIKDLQTSKKSLNEFIDVSKRVLDYLPSVISERHEVKGYILLSSEVAGTKKFVRPIRNSMFIFNPDEFQSQAEKYISILENISKEQREIPQETYKIVDSITYTIQQSIGVGLDLLSNPNSARKHVGNRFEELIRLILTKASVTNKKIVFKISSYYWIRSNYYRSSL